MQYHIDLGTFVVEADSEEAAYEQARKMIDQDPSWAEICNIELVDAV